MTKTERHAVGHEEYIPNPEVQKKLAQTVLVQLIGPTAVGKSTLIDLIVSRNDSHFSEVGTLTTRPKRETDSPWVTADISHEEMKNKIDNHELVQYFRHPSGEMYATDTSSYRTDVCLLPTMAKSADEFLDKGFKKVVRVGIVVNQKQWQERLHSRENDNDFAARMQEALQCLEWMSRYRRRAKYLQTPPPSLFFIENNNDSLESATQKIIDIIENPTDTALQLPRMRFNSCYLEMYAIARRYSPEKKAA
jgi:guanylate kinase